ncbi:hypothetical protein FACUT_5533 [Fusarium acutatum]|uniref:Uncharacterized protein n=1 Tax=Fusarium acutatum TaxID=78861 RepID=A0A8H4JTA5_9HYPO|nr:hypothetical protein FACUT_5533 [Fusarium acutatum]
MGSYNNNLFELPADEPHNTRPAGYDSKNPYFPPPPAYSANSTSTQEQSTTMQINRKSGFANRLHALSAKIAGPVNDFANKLGCEAFMPTTLDKECEKAARILTSFCEGTPLPPNESLSKRKALVKIPRQVLKTAAGLAIFTAFRSGAQFSWGSGSGVVVARRPDGSWSPPSSFAVNTLSVGFMVAMDIYDCVCVLRTPEAVAAFTQPRVSFGGEVAVTAGPVGTGVYVDSTVNSNGVDEPIWSYVKSRGLYVGAQIDGTVITTRDKANEDFYGVEVPVASILRGEQIQSLLRNSSGLHRRITPTAAMGHPEPNPISQILILSCNIPVIFASTILFIPKSAVLSRIGAAVALSCLQYSLYTSLLKSSLPQAQITGISLFSWGLYANGTEQVLLSCYDADDILTVDERRSGRRLSAVTRVLRAVGLYFSLRRVGLRGEISMKKRVSSNSILFVAAKTIECVGCYLILEAILLAPRPEGHLITREKQTFWHQLFRKALTGWGDFIPDKVLRFRRGTLLSRYSRLILTFFTSALMHRCLHYFYRLEAGEWYEMETFFLLQPLAIIFEDGVQAVTVQIPLPRQLRWIVGFIWLCAFFTWVTPTFLYPTMRVPDPGQLLPFSVLGRLIEQ